MVELGPGCSFLDVGCGTGAVLVRAAARVANTEPAVGIDISHAMLLRAGQSLATERLAAQLAVADAECLPFPDAFFDVVVSNFAFTSFPAPERAAVEMRRVLNPGGRLAIVISSGWWFQNDPGWRWHEDLLANLGVALGMSRLRDPQALESVLEGAGFRLTSIGIEIFPLGWTDANEWWEWNWSHGYRQVLESLSDARLQKYRTECFKRLGVGPVNGRLEVVVAIGQ